MYTQISIISNFTNIGLYAPKGVWVDIISYTAPVYICEYQGKRFSCHEGKLGVAMPPAEEVKQPIKSAQTSLF